MRFVTPTRRWTVNYYITWCTGISVSWRVDAGMRTKPQRGWAPRPPVEQPRRTGKKRYYGHMSGVNMLQFCSVSNSLSHTNLSIKWEVYFSKELCRSSLLCRRYYSACICICVCIVVMAIQQEDQTKKRTCSQENFFLFQRIKELKVKESEKIIRYLYLARELKSCWISEWQWYQL